LFREEAGIISGKQRGQVEAAGGKRLPAPKRCARARARVTRVTVVVCCCRATRQISLISVALLHRFAAPLSPPFPPPPPPLPSPPPSRELRAEYTRPIRLARDFCVALRATFSTRATRKFLSGGEASAASLIFRHFRWHRSRTSRRGARTLPLPLPLPRTAR